MPLLYKLEFRDGGAAAATTVETLMAMLRGRRPGRYPIVELRQDGPLTTERPWGVAIVHDDGRIEYVQET